MSENHANFDEVLANALQLTPSDKVRLITQLATMLEREVSALSATITPRPSLYGILKGTSISAEDIDEARREMWGNFPRDDIV